MNLTPRMINWITTLGVHIATSDKKGFPSVIVVDSSEVDGDYISFRLTEKQVNQIKANIHENPYVAIAPGKIGSIRAPYQIKGPAKLDSNKLIVSVEEIYCTKPGAESGIRLDTLGFDKMKDFDESRWTDFVPSGN